MQKRVRIARGKYRGQQADVIGETRFYYTVQISANETEPPVIIEVLKLLVILLPYFTELVKVVGGFFNGKKKS